MSPRVYHGRIAVHAGDCLEVLRSLPDNSIDAVCTDPPYHLTSIVKRFGNPNAQPAKGNAAFIRASRGFMGKQWDGGDIAFTPELWAEVLRVLKPGGHMVAFSGTRTYHRMACAIEDAGFEIRDQLAWCYGSGFPKSHDVSKGIDKSLGVNGTLGAPKSAAHAGWIDRGAMRGENGHEGYQRPWMQDEDAVDRNARQYIGGSEEARQWQGWGTALKPAWEPICLARKPLSEPTVAANVLKWGTGAINVDGCRIGVDPSDKNHRNPLSNDSARTSSFGIGGVGCLGAGRFPANLIHDGSPEVMAGFPVLTSRSTASIDGRPHGTTFGGNKMSEHIKGTWFGDSGSAARFFYTAKADADDRLGSKHPTVKPVDLMQWLVRLICPKGGTVLDPFAGTGTTGAAAFIEGCRAVLIEREAEYLTDIGRRMELLLSGPEERSRKLTKPEPYESLPLFGAL